MDPDKTTLIDADSNFEGGLKGKDARIFGRFKGDIALSGRLHMGEGCRVEAKVKSDVIEIAGEFQGELLARSLTLLERAKVSGTVDAQVIAMREGALLNGSVNVGAAGKPQPVTGAVVPPPSSEGAVAG